MAISAHIAVVEPLFLPRSLSAASPLRSGPLPQTTTTPPHSLSYPIQHVVGAVSDCHSTFPWCSGEWNHYMGDYIGTPGIITCSRRRGSCIVCTGPKNLMRVMWTHATVPEVYYMGNRWGSDSSLTILLLTQFMWTHATVPWVWLLQW